MNQSHIIILLLILISCTVPGTTSQNQQPNNRYENIIYEREIKTVRVYPDINQEFQQLYPAVAEIGKSTIVIEFDDLVENTENYYARLIHCNANWEPSRLSPLQYLDTYNEFPINDYELSSGTRIPYIHYSLKLPMVKISGNYIVEIYRNTTDEVVFRYRVMYFQKLIDIISENQNFAFNPTGLNQRINFKIDYTNYDLINPLERINVVIRQNQRWDNSLFNLKPTYIRPDLYELEYQYFDNENIFSGGNEFRAFDLRSITSGGANIQKIDVINDTINAILMYDKPRDYQAYAINKDLNGGYVVMNYDRGNDIYEADYVKVVFTLKTGRKFLGDIYIHGDLTNWATIPDTRMKYYESLKGYQKSLLLKQGWYNYQYLLKNDTLKNNYLEGQHWETENSYEIFVYYRSLNLDADILIGYAQWNVNPQF